MREEGIIEMTKQKITNKDIILTVGYPILIIIFIVFLMGMMSYHYNRIDNHTLMTEDGYIIDCNTYSQSCHIIENGHRVAFDSNGIPYCESRNMIPRTITCGVGYRALDMVECPICEVDVVIDNGIIERKQCSMTRELTCRILNENDDMHFK